jgi:large subunit ribosomal protein L6
MSRIGKLPIDIPSGVKVDIKGLQVTVKGKLGTLSKTLPEGISLHQEDSKINVVLEDPGKSNLWGLSRSLLNNMVIGVSQGIQKVLQIVGTGYRATLDGDNLKINIGYSHPVEISSKVPEGMSENKIKTSKWIKKFDGIDFELNKEGNQITVKGIDKQVVGQMAALIRGIRPPEPYKGKGIRYIDEWIRRKAGKAAASTQ